MSLISVEVLLVIISPNLERPGESLFLLEEAEGKMRLPVAPLGEQESVQVAGDLLFAWTGHKTYLQSGWLELEPCRLRDSSSRIIDGIRVLGIPYACTVSRELTPGNPRGQWFSVPDLVARPGLDADTREILLDACTTV